MEQGQYFDSSLLPRLSTCIVFCHNAFTLIMSCVHSHNGKTFSYLVVKITSLHQQLGDMYVPVGDISNTCTCTVVFIRVVYCL